MRHDSSLLHALASTHRKWSQQERCKRCKGSRHDAVGAWCYRMELELEFASGDVRIARDDRITCDGKEWHYAEVSDG